MKKLMAGFLAVVLMLGVGAVIENTGNNGGSSEVVPLSPGGGGIGGNKPS